MAIDLEFDLNEVKPIEYLGLKGRAIHKPGPTKRTFLIVYGHHSSLERMKSMADYLGRYGSIYMPDLPGFGGMDSFYEAGKKPSLDEYAAYLNWYIDKYLPGQKITILGMSNGALFVSQFLQHFPAKQKQVESIISYVGFAKHSDFSMYLGFKTFARILFGITSYKWPARLVDKTFLQGVMVRGFLKILSIVIPKQDKDKETQEIFEQFEVGLWEQNDFQTHSFTLKQMLEADITSDGVIELELENITTDHDQYFSAERTEASLSKIYRVVKTHKSSQLAHAPSLIADTDEVASYIPDELKKRFLT